MQLIRGVGLDEILATLQMAGGSSSTGTEEDVRRPIARPPSTSIAEVSQSLIDTKFRPADTTHAERSRNGNGAAGKSTSSPSTAPNVYPSDVTQTAFPSPNGTARRRDSARPASSAAKTPCEQPDDGPHWQCVAEIGVQVAEALDYAHSQGTLHRDIKPANLLLDTQGIAWITDFGLAKASHTETVSRTGDLPGTLRYMAPERFTGEADARSDTYSLGLTLYELLTLRPAFDESDRSELLLKVLHHQPPRPRKLRPKIPRDLETIVLKSIARDPADRYQTAANLAADLRRFVEDRPIEARRATFPERFWRWSRRNPVISALASTVVALLIVVAVVSAVGYARARQASQQVGQALEREQQQRERAEANSSLAREVLDRIYAQSAPVDRVGTSSLIVESSQGNEIEVPLQPALSEENASLSENLLVFYDRLAEDAGDDPKLLRETAEANRRVGDIQRRLGQSAKAVTAYQRALGMYGKLEKDSSGDTSFLAQIAGIYNEIGILHRASGDLEDAYKAHQSALEALESRSAEPSQSPRVEYELARTYYYLGTISWRDLAPESPSGHHLGFRWGGPTHKHGHPPPHHAHGHGPPPRLLHDAPPHERPPRGPGHPLGKGGPPRPPDEILPHPGQREVYLEKAISLLDGLCRQYPDNTDPASAEYHHLLACCYRDFPPAHSTDEKKPERIDDAIEILKGLVKQYPEVPKYQYDLVEAYARQDVHRWPERSDPTAQQQLWQAFQLSDKLVADHPDVPAFSALQVRVFHKLSQSQRFAGKPDEAEASLRKALTLQASLADRFPGAPSYTVWLAMLRRSLARLYLDGGDTDKAKALFEESIATLRPLLDGQRELPFVPRLLSETYHDLAGILDRSEKEASAEAIQEARWEDR